MPYKEKWKTGEARKRKKAGYRVSNWSEYNRSLKKRGKISLYFPEGDLKTQFINEHRYVKGVSGQEPMYRQAYIELIYVWYRQHGWGMRQIEGYMEDYWSQLKLDIPVPSFGHLSDRFASKRPTAPPVNAEAFVRYSGALHGGRSERQGSVVAGEDFGMEGKRPIAPQFCAAERLAAASDGVLEEAA